MIIKSMSRKEPSFDQLFDYISSKAISGKSILHNLESGLVGSTLEDYKNEFKENANYLPPRANGNYLYHEVISEKMSDTLPLERQKEILHDLASQYLEARGKDLLAWGMMHREKDQLHYHLVISANPVEDSKRYRLSKANYAEIQRNLEAYAHERYPDFTRVVLYNHETNPHHKFNPNRDRLPQKEREQRLRHRTGEPTKKDKLRQILQHAFQYAETAEELERILASHDARFYQRGKSISVEYGKMKARLRTLGMEENYHQFYERLNRPTFQEPCHEKTLEVEPKKTEPEPSRSKDDDYPFEYEFEME